MKKNDITDDHPIYIQQVRFDPSNEKHIKYLNKVDKIDIYYGIPGFQCKVDIFEQLINYLYSMSGDTPCLFIPINNYEIQDESITDQSKTINKFVHELREKFNQNLIKKLSLGKDYFSKFRETWIGFSQGGTIAFECWWEARKFEFNYNPRLVLCNTSLFGCSLLYPLETIGKSVPKEILPNGVKDLLKESSKDRLGERWNDLNPQNCLIAGNLSATYNDKGEYVNNIFASIGFNTGPLDIKSLVTPFLPKKGDGCYSANDQYPKELSEKGIRFISLQGHHVESLLNSYNAQKLAKAIVNWK